MNMNKILLTIFFILCMSDCAYVPEVLGCASIPFLNMQLNILGPTIDQAINNATIPNITQDQKIDGIHVVFNLTEIKQNISIHWNTSVIKIQDEHTMTVLSKNVNVTMTGHLYFKIGLGLHQKGTLDIDISELQTDTTVKFTQPNCSASQNGLGFDVQVQKLYANPQKIVVKVQGHGIDNIVIKSVINTLQSRLPGIIQKIALQKVNPLITQITCKGIQEVAPIGDQSYVVIVNTTNIPHFHKQNLYAGVDITFVNQITNTTNNQIQNDNLPEVDLFDGKAQAWGVASSNMLNTILWLIDDSNVLELQVTNRMLGPSPPIQLNTLNLSILIPSLNTKWQRRQVILVIGTSSKFSHLYLRNGKSVASMGLSVKFVVNVTGEGNQTAKECLQKKQCEVAVDLNMTSPFSIAFKIQDGNVLRGLLHTVAVQKLGIISSQVQVDLVTLKRIMNIMVGSFRPQINKMLADGIPLDLSLLEKFNITGVLLNMKKDYAGAGIIFKE